MTLKFIIPEPKANVLLSPNEFFNTLNGMFKNSKKRIVISCLYIGAGELVKELIESIKTNVNIRNVKVDILIDKHRGTRKEEMVKESSVDIISELFDCCDNINISLFHNPLLGAILYNILPHRINEGVGVMHMKAFIGDDLILLSGANISDSYLKNRQDRYFLIENNFFANSVHKIINAIQNMSFTLHSDLNIKWENDLINPLVEAHLFREQYYRRIKYILKEIQNDIFNYNKNYLNVKYISTFINSHKYLNSENHNISGENKKIIADDKQNHYQEIHNKNKWEVISGHFLNFLSELKKSVFYKNCNEEKIKYDSENKNGFNKTTNEKNEFFYPLYEKKKILIIELSLQCGFSLPPIYDESEMLEKLLKNIKNYNQSLTISSGYLNFTENYLKIFRNIYDNLITKKGKVLLITASPASNGFYKSKGISRYLPFLYSVAAHLSIEFITKNTPNLFLTGNEKNGLKNENNSYSNIYLEYDKPSWTFHSKGIWITNHLNKKNNINYEHLRGKNYNQVSSCNNYENDMNMSENCDKEEEMCVHNRENAEFINSANDDHLNEYSDDLPWITVIGSSNYGYRATYRDLEMSFVIKTNDYHLKQQFQKELNILYDSSRVVKIDELKLRYSRWLKLFMKYILKWVL